MTALKIIEEIQDLGIELWESDGQLKFRAPRGVFTRSLKEKLQAHRNEVIEELSSQQSISIEADPDNQYLPFPLTDVQSAYLIGRIPGIPYGGIPCQAYMELELPFLKLENFEVAYNEAIRIHPMLRVRVYREGYQEISPLVEHVQIPLHYLKDSDNEKEHCHSIRQRLLNEYRVKDNGHWPLIQIEITRLPNQCVIHVLVDLLLADFVSVDAVLNQVIQTANGIKSSIPASDLSFRDYVITMQKTRTGSQFRKAKDYWTKRIPLLPAMPQLPLNSGFDQYAAVTDEPFMRMATEIKKSKWKILVERSKKFGVTPSCLLLGAYTEVVRRWSRQSSFTLNLTMMNRPAWDEDISHIIGDFTSILLLAVETPVKSNFIKRLQILQNQLWQDLEHSMFSGIDVVHELSREKGRDNALMPVVFTSTVGTTDSLIDKPETQTTVVLRDGITWTPQVWLDCQVLEAGGKIYINWDYRVGIFSEKVVDDMFNSYIGLLDLLADDIESWQQDTVVRFNTTAIHDKSHVSPYSNKLLHQGFLDSIKNHPDRVAVNDSEHILTYEQLYKCVVDVVNSIEVCDPGNFVAIVMDKSVAQVIAVLAVLISGRAYIPVDSQQPTARKVLILKDAKVKLILTQPWLTEQESYKNIELVIIDPENIPEKLVSYNEKKINPESIAYLIYTSGSTGKPKGVVMSHQAAANTIADINHRINLDMSDVVLGLAGLAFDLSVYDIFGTLSVGAALVLPEQKKLSNPNHWAHIIEQKSVSVWNSVPAQAVMLYDFLNTLDENQIQSLRIMLLSGDWVPVTLAANLKTQNQDLKVISLGGATEAAIWSIWHEITDKDASYTSIPYGLPLTGQDLYVMNEQLDDCPEGVIGEIMISGLGLAECYFDDSNKTHERFIFHPVTKMKLYRTGDIGRYLSNGEIEFLGREDQQVKINGHRVELEEISTVLENHPAINSAAVVFDQKKKGFLAVFIVAQSIDEKERQHRLIFQEEFNRILQKKSLQLCDSLDEEALLKFTHQLDLAAKASVIELIYGLYNVSEWEVDELLNKLDAPEYYHRLINRWIISLTGSGYLIVESNRYCINEEKYASLNVDLEWVSALLLSRKADYPDILFDYFKNSASKIREQVSGNLDPLELFFHDNNHDIALAAFNDNPSARLCNQLAANAITYLCESLSKQNDVVNILEVGAGVGGLTQHIVPQLNNINCNYQISDISQYYLTDAEKIYESNSQISIKRFDVMQDPVSQGFKSGEFDILVCGDLLHAVVDIPKALHNLGKVLRAGGYIILLEATREHVEALISLEFMLTLKESNGRFHDFRNEDGKTFISIKRWKKLLTDEGWKVSSILPDGSLSELGLQIIVASNNFDTCALSSTQITSYLNESLPQYMMPKQIHLLQSLPLSTNGKIDRKQLQELMNKQDVLTPTSTHEPPGTDIERAIAKLWGQALNSEITDRNAGFFQLGGDSLIAARLSGQLLEQIDEINHRHFDEILRLFMGGLSVAELASRLLEPSEIDDSISSQNKKSKKQSVRLQKNFNIRQGIGKSTRLFILLDVSGSATDELNELSAELVMEGSVAQLNELSVKHSSLHSWTFSYYEQWIKELIVELNEANKKENNWESMIVVGFASNCVLALDLARRLYLAKPECGLESLLISPQEPIQDNGAISSIQMHANTQDFIVFDLNFITDTDTSLTFYKQLKKICLGEINTVHCDLSNELVDMVVEELFKSTEKECLV